MRRALQIASEELIRMRDLVQQYHQCSLETVVIPRARDLPVSKHTLYKLPLVYYQKQISYALLITAYNSIHIYNRHLHITDFVQLFIFDRKYWTLDGAVCSMLTLLAYVVIKFV